MASSKSIKYWIVQANRYLRRIGYKIDPLPKIVLDGKEHDVNDLLARTGHYEPDTQTVVLHTSNRHLKDILRTYFHELVHHHQNITGNTKLQYALAKGGDLEDNDMLEVVEAEAYLQGNLNFRKFTEKLAKALNN